MEILRESLESVWRENFGRSSRDWKTVVFVRTRT